MKWNVNTLLILIILLTIFNITRVLLISLLSHMIVALIIIINDYYNGISMSAMAMS